MKKKLPWLLPIAAMLLITPFTPFLDVALSGYFYDESIQSFQHNLTLKWIFHLGVFPALLCGAFAFFVLAVYRSLPYWKPYRAPALVMALTLAIGAGLIINTILKDHWGRPRPKQIEEFGGEQQFRPYYLPNFDPTPEPSKSFPSGHSSMGFFFFSVCLIASRHRNKKLLILGIAITTLLGGALSYTRIAQGGHFFSDVLITALIMWLVALSADWLAYDKWKLYQEKPERNHA